ncbi:M1 family aminopeptidase [Hymenobacter sp. H14-R3]|uniref:M1 family aminopeptidase n=1 Tax=Hymenobacter sp. H14-R3 TaxID=3046308 RepID=UPI0024B9B8FF|nr:M1 family aminopeptidase [Hymenobacter sp. H14-R3]MDJ0365459.1 M1 family aminopeptidase [Hymenobacter sp. H14-R3]
MSVNYRKYGVLGGLLLAAACQRATYPTAATAATTPSVPPVVTGVSRELAEFRKQTISRVAYELRLAVPASKADPVRAEETIRFRLRDNRTPVQLDFKGQASQLRSLTINGQPAVIDYRQEHLVLPASALRTGDNVIGIILTAGDLSLNRNADYLYTLLVPDRARTVVPVFDQPNLKATITLALDVPGTWEAVANGPLRETSPPTADDVKPGVKSYAFAPSDSISTYLFSFAAGKFTRVSQRVNGRPMSFLHRETDSTKIRLSMPTIFRLHGEALSFLEQYTGIPYPFQKFDFTAIPDFQYGGMEHVGNIDYKAASLFLDEGATKDQLLARQNLIGHETAHMWFGDLVTMQWFNDVWMKEVFANFMADKMNPEAAAGPAQLLKFVTDHYPAAYAVDRTAGANPIRQPLENLQNAGSLYGGIIYHKAPIMMRQLERLMGEQPFQEGVREYLKKYAHGNATWLDLIAILDAHTPADLAAWNQVWVNQPGRPVFDYTLQTPAGQPAQLIISQHAEDGSDRLWPQQFEVLAVYPSGPVALPVNMSQREVRVALPAGKGVPSYVLLNAQGLGYGVFPVAPQAADHLASLPDPVARASTYIALYENMLSGRGLAPRLLLDRYLAQTAHETNDLNIKLLTGQMSAIFWQFLKPAERDALAPDLEKALWLAMQAQAKPGEQKLYFKAYQSIALTLAAQQRLYRIWRGQKAPGLVKLTEDDYTALALALAVRDYPTAQPILPQQLARITNVDRRQRLQFMMPALSPEVATRDAFFASLKDEKNREKEAWVQAALGYLHHPLRQATSEKYLPASLDLLEEIQQTGDIFFPAGWLQGTLGSYQSATAAATVRGFLAAHPGYNPPLRAKLLQAADDLFRAEKLAR